MMASLLLCQLLAYITYFQALTEVSSQAFYQVQSSRPTVLVIVQALGQSHQPGPNVRYAQFDIQRYGSGLTLGLSRVLYLMQVSIHVNLRSYLPINDRQLTFEHRSKSAISPWTYCSVAVRLEVCVILSSAIVVEGTANSFESSATNLLRFEVVTNAI